MLSEVRKSEELGFESPLDSKEIKPVNPKGNQHNIHWKDWCWSSSTLATWFEELIHWKRPWCWERWKAGGEGGDRGWAGWMASPSRWTWVWASCRNWSWTGKPGVLQSMGLWRVGHDWSDLASKMEIHRHQSTTCKLSVWLHPVQFNCTLLNFNQFSWPQLPPPEGGLAGPQEGVLRWVSLAFVFGAQPSPRRTEAHITPAWRRQWKQGFPGTQSSRDSVEVFFLSLQR